MEDEDLNLKVSIFLILKLSLFFLFFLVND